MALGRQQGRGTRDLGGHDVGRPSLGRQQPAQRADPTDPVERQAELRLEHDDEGEQPDNRAGLQDLRQEPQLEGLGREVHDEQDRHADDEPHRAGPADDAEQPVDQERRDPDVEDRRGTDLVEDRGEELRHRRPSVLRAPRSPDPRAVRQTGSDGCQGAETPRRRASRRAGDSSRRRSAARRWTSASAWASPLSDVSRSRSSIFSVATDRQPRSSWRLAMARWTRGSPGAIASSWRHASRAASTRPASRWTAIARRRASRAPLESPASRNASASAWRTAGSGGGPTIAGGGGEGRSIAGHSPPGPAGVSASALDGASDSGSRPATAAIGGPGSPAAGWGAAGSSSRSGSVAASRPGATSPLACWSSRAARAWSVASSAGASARARSKASRASFRRPSLARAVPMLAYGSGRSGTSPAASRYASSATSNSSPRRATWPRRSASLYCSNRGRATPEP